MSLGRIVRTNIAEQRLVLRPRVSRRGRPEARAEITKEFKGRVVVVLNKETADAIMRGIGENHTGLGAAITGRYIGLQDNASGAISLVDRGETTVLWASEAGDRSLIFSVASRGGQRKVADRLVNNLKKALAQ